MPHAASQPSGAGFPVPPVELLRRIALPTGVDPGAWHAGSGAAHKRSLVGLLPEDWTWDGKTVLDFGCGVGRLLVQFLDEARRTRRFAACDIDGPSIAWLTIHFAPPFEIRHTQEDPPLPWPDGTFDLVYAASVFTH